MKCFHTLSFFGTDPRKRMCHSPATERFVSLYSHKKDTLFVSEILHHASPHLSYLESVLNIVDIFAFENKRFLIEIMNNRVSQNHKFNSPRWFMSWTISAPMDIEPVTTTTFESIVKLHEIGVGVDRCPTERGILSLWLIEKGLWTIIHSYKLNCCGY